MLQQHPIRLHQGQEENKQKACKELIKILM